MPLSIPSSLGALWSAAYSAMGGVSTSSQAPQQPPTGATLLPNAPDPCCTLSDMCRTLDVLLLLHCRCPAQQAGSSLRPRCKAYTYAKQQSADHARGTCLARVGCGKRRRQARRVQQWPLLGWWEAATTLSLRSRYALDVRGKPANMETCMHARLTHSPRGMDSMYGACPPRRWQGSATLMKWISMAVQVVARCK
jgi:hypothetical protein